MIIDRAAYQVMIQHMQEAAPREGVGLLAGPLGARQPLVDRWVPQINASEFPRARYEVDPAETLATWQALDADGWRPWIVCHSHVHTSAAPSDNDIRYATDPSLLHMIVSLHGMREGTEPTAVLWRLNPYRPGAEGVSRVRYQVVDLGFQGIQPTDLTRGVTGA